MSGNGSSAPSRAPCPWFTLAALLFAGACSDGDGTAAHGDGGGVAATGNGTGGTTALPDGVFESDDPLSPAASMHLNAGTGGMIPENGDRDRAAASAEITALDAGRLYTLSQGVALNVIDVAAPDRLPLLGSYAIGAWPVELAVRDGIAFVVYEQYGRDVFDATTNLYRSQRSSYVAAVDARDPAAMVELGGVAIPGYVIDAHVAGDVLYVVARENGWCWSCAPAARTTVTSFDLTSSTGVVQIDQLAFDDRTEFPTWARGVTFAEQRLYVSGPTPGVEPTTSTIQVVELAGGRMTPAQTLTAPGVVRSGRQMDEYLGVLRVVSMPPPRPFGTSHQLTTFAVTGATGGTALGSATFELPQPATLDDVRFDGPRGYVLSSQGSTRPRLLDLLDPAAPRVAAELPLDGPIQLQPQGDRLLALSGAADATLALFDVQSPAAPALIDAVSFPASTAYRTLELVPGGAPGLAAVASAGWNCETGQHGTGLQLVTWDAAGVELGPALPALGAVRRTLLDGARLLALSDARLESFQLQAGADPLTGARVSLVSAAPSRVRDAGGKLLRIGLDEVADVIRVDLASLDDPSRLGDHVLDIPELGGVSDCNGMLRFVAAHADADAAHLLLFTNRRGLETSYVVSVDTSDLTAPSRVAELVLDAGGLWNDGYYHHAFGAAMTGTPSVMLGSTLAAVDRRSYLDEASSELVQNSFVEVVDLSDVVNPTRTRVDVPYGVIGSALLGSGSVVATSHYELSPTTPGKVRFYVDRVDVSDPRSPVASASVNVPGSLLAFDAATGYAVTVDYRAEEVLGLSEQECRLRFRNPSFDGVCRGVVQSLKLVRLDGDRAELAGIHELAPHEIVTASAMAGDRVFAVVEAISSVPAVPGCSDCGHVASPWRTFAVVTVGGIQSGDFASGRVELDRGGRGDGPERLIVASGTRAVVSSPAQNRLALIDGADAFRPALVRELEIPALDLAVVGSAAVAASYGGVRVVPFDGSP